MVYYLNPEEIGLYGIFFSAIYYFMYFIGFEFYTYSTREIASNDKSQWSTFIRDQFIFVFILLVFLIPLSLAIFYFELLPIKTIYYFYPILLIEYLAQEINRLLVAMSRQIQASIVLFFRSGLWPIFLIASFWFFPGQRTLSFMFVFWIIGGLSSIIVGVFFLLDVIRIPTVRTVSKTWITNGIMVAIPLLIATLSSKSLFSFDRFFIEHFANLSVLAAYVFFASIAGAISAFVDAAIIVFFYPKMIVAGKNKEIAQLNELTNSMMKQIILLSVFLSVTFFIGFNIFLQYFSHREYKDYFYFIYFTLASISLFCLSMSPHLALYSLRKDKLLVLSNVFCLAIFVIFSFVFGNIFSAIGVLYSLLISCFLLFAIKYAFYFFSSRSLNKYQDYV
ncbi:hypothetical protein [Pectobacterium carotovorum]|nr:hypothetical protein [Pectobacterium carotovorum]